MKRPRLIISVLFALSWTGASATVINIPVDYPIIQAGIDASFDGDTVLIHPGTYVENLNFNGLHISLGSLYMINRDTSYISLTIVDGDSAGSVITLENGEDGTALIVGLTIRNGLATGGGGIRCIDSDPTIANNRIIENRTIPLGDGGAGIFCDRSSPTIVDNNILNNYSSTSYTSQGGGIYCRDHSNPVIKGNTISGNVGREGGGIHCNNGSDPIIQDNIISGNSAPIDGGSGIACRDDSDPIIADNTITGNSSLWNMGGGILCASNSDPRIINNLISGNHADDHGGGIHCRGYSNPLIQGNIIVGNAATIYGGGIYCYAESYPLIINNVILGNSAYRGGGLFCSPNSGPTVTNCIMRNNSPSEIEFYDETAFAVVTYCDIGGGWEGEGNIDVDPLFRNRSSGDYHLMSAECGDVAESPCIDAGHFDVFDSTLSCFRGLGTVISDMGAYGGGIILPHSGRTIDIPEDFPTIQEGIDASWDGDTVLVQPGLYVENLDFNRHKIIVASLFLTTGDDSYISTTVIDGDGAGSVVTFQSGEDSTSVITGFTIQNGSGNDGGGIYCEDSRPIIRNNYIRGNSASWRSGGGICCWGADPEVYNNVISGNHAAIDGGGIYCFESDPVFRNNVIYENSAGNDGGGLCCYESSPLIDNTVIWGNTANMEGDEIYVNSGSPMISYSDIQGGWQGGGNIDADPLFRDPESHDFHLMSSGCGDPFDSPCIDTGDPSIYDDRLDCDWGLGTERSDMGTYGGGAIPTGIPAEIGPVLPSQLSLRQNYPNPFNASTTIGYSLPDRGNVSLSIYNLLGQRVATLIEGVQQAGEHTITWDASAFPSGVYFARLEAGGRSETVKIVLLK